MSESAAASVVVAIGAYATFSLGRSLYLAAVSRRWPKADAHIERSALDVANVSGPKGPVNLEGVATVTYTYFAGGRLRWGSRIQYGPEWWWFASREIRRYPAGTVVRVAYDPAEPDRVVLRPGITWSTALGFPMGLALLMTGLTWMVRSWR